MTIKNISRRNLIKSTVAFFAAAQFSPAVSLAAERDRENEFALDSDYVVINGWVLLKSDVALD